MLFLFVVSVRRIGDFGVETDFYGTYAPGARAIREGHIDVSRYGVTGPLYELLLALGMIVGLPVFTWAKVISALSILGTFVLWRRIARTTLGARTGRWVPWLLLLSPTFVRFGYIASSDGLYCLLFSLGLFILTRAQTPLESLKAGAAALLAFLARYQALVFPGFAFLWWIGKARALRLWGTYLLVFPGALVATLLVASLAGLPIPKPDFLYNIHYEASEGHIDWDDYLAQSSDRGNPWEILIRQPGAVLSAAISNVPGHLKNQLLDGAGPILAVLVLAGAAGLFVRSLERGIALRFAAFWLLQFILLLPTQASERYALTQIPLMVVVAGWGLEVWVERLRGVQWAVPAVSGLLVLGLILNVEHQVAYQKRQPRFLLDTASGLHSTVQPTDRLMTRKPHLPFLLGCHWVYFPDSEDVESLRGAMTRTPAEYLYYGRSEIALRPNFRFLSFPPYRPSGWEVVRADSNGVLYRIEEAFFSADIPPDDAVLRQLENATMSGAGIPLEEARRLAAYLTQTGRCEQALREYERIRKFAPLTPEEEHNIEYCRTALTAHQE